MLHDSKSTFSLIRSVFMTLNHFHIKQWICANRVFSSFLRDWTLTVFYNDLRIKKIRKWFNYLFRITSSKIVLVSIAAGFHSLYWRDDGSVTGTERRSLLWFFKFFLHPSSWQSYLMGAPEIFLQVTVPLAVARLLPCHWAMQSADVFKSTANFSQTFFFGFSCSSELPDSYPSTKTWMEKSNKIKLQNKQRSPTFSAGQKLSH